VRVSESVDVCQCVDDDDVAPNTQYYICTYLKYQKKKKKF
jgi:hypothetical protein